MIQALLLTENTTCPCVRIESTYILLLNIDCRNIFLLPNSIVAAGVIFSIFKQHHVVCVKAQECEVHYRRIFPLTLIYSIMNGGHVVPLPFDAF